MLSPKVPIHEKIFNISWGDMDALGHVNNARYFDYFQQSRIEWLESLDLNLLGETGPVVIKISCTYLKPLVYPATIKIVSKLHSIGNASLMLDHDIYEHDKLVAEGVCKIVWVNFKQAKSVPLPEIFKTIS